jgi:nitrogen regulatory protein P-II 2
MQTTPMKLVTIIAEAVLEEHLIRDLRRLGAKGYTIGSVRGEGNRGVHASDWAGHNLRIEVLAPPPVAERIVEYIAGNYFSNYAVIAYLADVAVVRPEKYQ